MMIRVSTLLHGRNAKTASAALPACLRELLDKHIIKYQGVLLDQDEMIERFLKAPSVERVLADKEALLYGIFETMARLDEQADASPLLSIQEWLALFKRSPIKGVTRAQMVMCFAVSQEIDDSVATSGKVEDRLLQVLDFHEFQEAVGRVTFASMSAKKTYKNMEAALEALLKRLGPFIDELGASFKPRAPPKALSLAARIAERDEALEKGNLEKRQSVVKTLGSAMAALQDGESRDASPAAMPSLKLKKADKVKDAAKDKPQKSDRGVGPKSDRSGKASPRAASKLKNPLGGR